MYIAEIAPSNIRGKLVSLNQMTIVLGILAEPIPAGSIASDIAASWNGQMAWRWMFWAAAVPSLAFLLMAFFIPESPRWQAMNGQVVAATDTLTRIGGVDYAHTEMRAISIANSAIKEQAGLATLFSRPFTIIAINIVDKLGRRKLMLIGALGLCIIYAILGLCYYLHITGFFMIVLVVAAIGCYAMTLGPCTWVLIAELFPNRVRAIAVATCTFALWVGSSTLTYTFPFLNASLGSYGTFWIYSLVCLVGFVFFMAKLPETKGKSLEQLEEELIKK